MLQEVYQICSRVGSFLVMHPRHYSVHKAGRSLCNQLASDFDVATEPDGVTHFESFDFSPSIFHHTSLHMISVFGASFTLIQVKKLPFPLSKVLPNDTPPPSSNKTSTI